MISECIAKSFRKYDDFSGRASRTEYWSFVFFCNFVLLVASLTLFHSFIPLLIVGTTISIPSFAIAVRRLHDVGRSGLWMLVLVLPLASSIMMIITFLQRDASTIMWSTLCLIGVLIGYLPARWLNSTGQVGPNKYGPDPMLEEQSLSENTHNNASLSALS